MSLAQRIASCIERALSWACGLVLAALLALVLATAIQRYGLGSGFLGAEEAGAWLLLALVCCGLPLAARPGTALRVDLFPAGAGRFEAPRAVLAQAIVLLAGLVLVSAGTRAAMMVGGTSPLLGLPEGLRPGALAASGAVALGMTALGLVAERRIKGLLAAGALAAGCYGAIALGARSGVLPPSGAAGLAVLIGIFCGAPLPHVFIVAGFAAIGFGGALVEPALALQLLSGMGRHLLLAIPFFLLAGGLLVASGLGEKLVRFAAGLVGRRRGGLGQTVLLTSLLFSGTSGSSIANAAFTAKAFFSPLVRAGYRPERAGAVIAATSVLDNIIPPSIAFFILATAASLPVGQLLTGGLFAGLLLALALAVMIHCFARDEAVEGLAAGESLWRLALAALPVAGLGVIVVAGIRFGVVTPTEAAGLAAAYTLAAALMARGGGVVSAFCRAGREAAAIIALIGAASPIAFLLAADGVTAGLARAVASVGADPVMVMLAANLLLLVVGLVLDVGAAILLFAPILLPVAMAAGIDPVAFGVMLVINLMIGALTPPVGILVQVVSGATGVPALRLFGAVLPYVAGLVLTLLAMSFGVVWLF